jgi:hypothetical protein
VLFNKEDTEVAKLHKVEEIADDEDDEDDALGGIDPSLSSLTRFIDLARFRFLSLIGPNEFLYFN